MSCYIKKQLLEIGGFNEMLNDQVKTKGRPDSLIAMKGAISLDCEWNPKNKDNVTQIGLTFISPDKKNLTVLYVIEEHSHLEKEEGSFSNKETAYFDFAITCSQEEAINEVKNILKTFNYGALIGHHVGNDLEIFDLSQSDLPSVFDTKSEVLRLISPLRKAAKLKKIRGISLSRIVKTLRVNSKRIAFHNASNDAYLTALAALRLIANPALSSIQLLNEVNEYTHPKK